LALTLAASADAGASAAQAASAPAPASAPRAIRPSAVAGRISVLEFTFPSIERLD
jgi:hypothetical protein